MDKTNKPIADELTSDDMDMLQYVLQNVRGSSPDSTYRQADFFEEFDSEV